MNQKKVVSNFLWRFLERTGSQVVGLIVSIVLARILKPSDYGTIALVMVFLTILQVFVDCGLGSALVQKKDADDLDFSSVFFFNILMCVVIYTILYFGAPLIALFYEDNSLIPIIRVSSLVIIVSGVKGIQQAYVSREMIFKKFFFATLIGTFISAIIGIYMAYSGFGVWALVAQYLTSAVVDTICLWVTVPWRPKLMFSLKRLLVLYSFGWKLLSARLISTVYSNLRQLLIGKYYTSEDLAYYNKGHEFPNKIVPNIETAVANVLLPTVSKEQDNIKGVLSITRRAIQVMAYLIWPMMFGMAACGKPLVQILLTEKWLPAVPYLQIFCIEAAFCPLSTIYNNSLNALGKTHLNLKVQIIVRTVGIIVLLFVLNRGVLYIAVSAFMITLLEFGLELVLNRKIIGYKFHMQFEDLVPPLCLSIIMGAIVYLISFIEINPICILIIQIAVGVLIYWSGSILLKIKTYDYILKSIIKMLGNKGAKTSNE